MQKLCCFKTIDRGFLTQAWEARCLVPRASGMQTLVVTVLDWDRLGKPDFLGQAKVSLADAAPGLWRGCAASPLGAVAAAATQDFELALGKYDIPIIDPSTGKQIKCEVSKSKAPTGTVSFSIRCVVAVGGGAVARV